MTPCPLFEEADFFVTLPLPLQALYIVGQEIDQEFVGVFIAGGELDSGGGGSGFEEGFDGLRSAALHPVGVGGGEDGSLQGSVAVAVERVDRGAAVDEKLDGGGLGSPCGDVEGGAVARDVEVSVTVDVERCGAYAEVEETGETFGVVVAGE